MPPHAPYFCVKASEEALLEDLRGLLQNTQTFNDTELDAVRCLLAAAICQGDDLAARVEDAAALLRESAPVVSRALKVRVWRESATWQSSGPVLGMLWAALGLLWAALVLL